MCLQKLGSFVNKDLKMFRTTAKWLGVSRSSFCKRCESLDSQKVLRKGLGSAAARSFARQVVQRKRDAVCMGA